MSVTGSWKRVKDLLKLQLRQTVRFISRLYVKLRLRVARVSSASQVAKAALASVTSRRYHQV